MFSWFRNRRRKKLAARPFPAEWSTALRENFPHSQWLSEPDQQRLLGIIQILIAEKYWEGCGGLQLTDEIRVTIAAQAALLVLGFDNEYFSRLVTILVYPSQYVAPEKTSLPGGVVVEDESERLGEAWHTGVVVLSWPDALRGGQLPTDGQNVVMHEFAHVLDSADQMFDGTPDLLPDDQYETWRDVMTAEYRRHTRAAAQGRWTLLDRYGAKSEAEFFAVATECFFERPQQMQARHPHLYDVLRAFYRQNPAQRVPA